MIGDGVVEKGGHFGFLLGFDPGYELFDDVFTDGGQHSHVGGFNSGFRTINRLDEIVVLG
ncbi:MAG: hypothetical protein BWY72_02484 [Bacteroidetes bacterium ADurb.Bin416]|nr:MAG: hypothetical protein BWY72_02484 [Bacteroidetes bacterium ADurb.Bin416]